MKDQATQVQLQTAAITDRGLSEKRPLNEDSFLADAQRRIFAVADGVGGAQAGEVASQTAVEVLDEAFRHQLDGADIEDLMELAIQRANASIHQMARDHPKLNMMATTMVALHLDGHTATIGHVGDSRLYRVSPDGKLSRETEDHSVVEEEVRAGRMTPDQAAHHPSRNVISRALGAEESVEVDLKTIEVKEGTSFLLCSDGITRHIPDNELAELLTSDQTPKEICAEMKRRCYERGAEDNLTAVLIRFGAHSQPATSNDDDDERTIVAERSALEATLRDSEHATPASSSASSLPASNTASVSGGLTPPSRIVFPATAAHEETTSANRAVASSSTQDARTHSSAQRGSTGGKIVRAFLFLLLVAAVGAGAFYGGMLYKQQRTTVAQTNVAPSPVASPVLEDTTVKFEKERRDVDQSPSGWLANQMKSEMASQSIEKPLDSNSPEFLYMYGRALLLTGDHDGAVAAFERAIAKLEEQTPAQGSSLKVDARLARAAAALRSDKSSVESSAIKALEEVIEKKNVANP